MCWSGPSRGPQLAADLLNRSVDQQPDRLQAMKILGRDFRLWNGDGELHFHCQHEIHHLQRADAEVAQLLVKREGVGHGMVSPKNLLYECDQSVTYSISLRIQSISPPEALGSRLDYTVAGPSGFSLDLT